MNSLKVKYKTNKLDKRKKQNNYTEILKGIEKELSLEMYDLQSEEKKSYLYSDGGIGANTNNIR